jgi:hypothetical protein
LKTRSFYSAIGFTLAAQVAALAFTYPLVQIASLVSFTPVSGDSGPFLNTLIFLALPILGSLLYLRFYKSNALKVALAVMESLLVAFLSFLVFILSGIDTNPSALLSGGAWIVGLVVLTRGGPLSKAIFSLLLSAEAGAYLALAFSPPTIYLVILAFALYDVYAVFRGPLKKLVERTAFGALTVDLGNVSMGMGDEIFYAMIPSAAYLIFGPLAAAVQLLVVDAGVVATLMLLTSRKALPGLTIPLLLSLAVFGAFALL